ncbi:MAG: hypothetical protein ABL993_02480 [Vicinamibacterales bacterium]
MIQFALDLGQAPRPPRKRKYVAKDARSWTPGDITEVQATAAHALSTWVEPTAEPQPKLSREERAAADPRVRTFHDELEAFRARHPNAPTVGRDKPQVVRTAGRVSLT